MKSLALSLLILLSGCSLLKTAPPVVLPPEIIKVPTFVPLPDSCSRLQSVALPAGTTAEQVMAAQNAALRAYEDQVRRCFAPKVEK